MKENTLMKHLCLHMQNRQPVVNQMSGLSNMNLPLRSNVPNQVSSEVTVIVQRDIV